MRGLVAYPLSHWELGPRLERNGVGYPVCCTPANIKEAILQAGGPS